MKRFQLTLALLASVLLFLGCSKSEPEPAAVSGKQAAVEQPSVQSGETVQTVKATEETSTPTAQPVKEKIVEEVVTETPAAVVPPATGSMAADAPATNAEPLDTPAGAAGSGGTVDIPETVVLENSKGRITMPHLVHATSFACQVCHGEGSPGPMEVGKDRGHTLCKGCHKDNGAGPTSCYGCHEKKPVRAVEGC